MAPKMIVAVGFAALALTACAGKVDYTPPTISPSEANSKTVDQPKEAVWKSLIPALGQKFFVINNLDKASGLINISYSGDPELYVDCGTITSYVKNARGERTYTFPAAQANQVYEVLTDRYYQIDRRMTLEGRMNLIVQEVSARQTKVTANTRYVLTRTQTILAAGAPAPVTLTHSINLNTGQTGSFPANADGGATTCAPNGKFEAAVLELVQ